MNDKARLRECVRGGESTTVEFKRSTGELREALQTLCAFANAGGGRVLLGVRADGRVLGQQVSEQTLHDVAAMKESFEPPLEVGMETVPVGKGLAVLVLSVAGRSDSVPFTFDGRPYERVGNTTRKMAQERYEALLFERAHSRRRWENQVADELSLKDIDRDEVLRIVGEFESIGRLVGSPTRRVTSALDRLGLRKDGELLRAAVVLFGKTFMPDYPQCELRMARFRGLTKAEFMDQRMVRGPAFRLLEEAQLFCQRHFPLPARIVPTQLKRVETPLIPPDALREILVNALIHRDYSIAGGAISLALFDDRVEVWSAGRFPSGITPELLKREHLSVQRNPLIADVFHRAGLIEKWGRGTNRVAEMCRAAGIAPPEFLEITGAAVVTFRVPVAGPARVTPHVAGEVAGEVALLVAQFREGPMTRRVIQAALGLRHEDHFREAYLVPALEQGFIEMTIPEKPRSRLQRYRLTDRGRAVRDGSKGGPGS